MTFPRLEVFRRADGRLAAEIVEQNLRRAWRRVEGTIDSSLVRVAATDAGAPASISSKFIQQFSFSVDFQRDVRSGDGFSLIYETLLDDNDRPVKAGALHYASLALSARSAQSTATSAPTAALDISTATGTTRARP